HSAFSHASWPEGAGAGYFVYVKRPAWLVQASPVSLLSPASFLPGHPPPMTKSIHDKAREEQVAHRHVPGMAYEVADAVTRLVHAVGGGFFNEPRYYDSNRPAGEFMRELLATGRISSAPVDEAGLTEQAREVLQTAQAVARSATPEDLLVVAAWCRDPREGLR